MSLHIRFIIFVNFAAMIVFSGATVARATPVPITLDTTQSNITATLTATVGTTATSSDTSPVAGTITIKVAPTTTTPASITMYDSHMELLDTIDLTLTFRVFGVAVGHLVAHSRAVPNNIKLDYAPTPPGTPQPSVAVAGNGAFSVPNVPSTTTGMVDYTSDGVVCVAFQQQSPPQPCNGTLDLASNGVQNGSFDGMVTVSAARVVTLVSNVNQTAPIDPNNPSMGTFSVIGTVRGSVTLPKRGDANLDGVVDVRDIQAFVNVIVNPGPATWQQRFAVNMNDDDVFNGADATLLAQCLLNGGCPS